MKLLLDENLPPLLAESIQVLARNETYEVHHVIPWLGAGTSDVNWIKTAGRDGGWIAITNDHHISTRPHEIAAWRQNGLIGFVLPKMFNQLTFWAKAAFLTRWWDEIIKAARTAAAGDMYLVPSKWTPDSLIKTASRRQKGKG